MWDIQRIVLECIELYGWYMLASTIAVVYLYSLLRPKWLQYKDYKEEEMLKKNPDLHLARMEAIQRVREQMQQRLAEESARAAVLQKEREDRKKRETAERLQRYLAENSDKLGHRLGTGDDDYLPLSGGGASTSSYKAPKRKCPGGGCGR